MTLALAICIIALCLLSGSGKKRRSGGSIHIGEKPDHPAPTNVYDPRHRP